MDLDRKWKIGVGNWETPQRTPTLHPTKVRGVEPVAQKLPVVRSPPPLPATSGLVLRCRGLDMGRGGSAMSILTRDARAGSVKRLWPGLASKTRCGHHQNSNRFTRRERLGIATIFVPSRILEMPQNPRPRASRPGAHVERVLKGRALLHRPIPGAVPSYPRTLVPSCQRCRVVGLPRADRWPPSRPTLAAQSWRPAPGGLPVRLRCGQSQPGSWSWPGSSHDIQESTTLVRPMPAPNPTISF
jgi:hypothetical protein